MYGMKHCMNLHPLKCRETMTLSMMRLRMKGENERPPHGSVIRDATNKNGTSLFVSYFGCGDTIALT